jgi:hypothetical protein
MRAQTSDETAEKETEATATFTSEQDIATLRRILKEIIEGPAFRGSHRSGQFLEFVVEAWIAGNFDQLKERLIGAHLFKRKPSYDTGEDAIVRVTASDVRRRLLQHYGWFGTDCEFRIELPSGSYVPRIRRKSQIEVIVDSSLEPHSAPGILIADAVTGKPAPKVILPQPVEVSSVVVAPETLSVVVTPTKSWPFWQKAGILIAATILGWWIHSLSRTVSSSASSVLPWPALFNSSAVTHVVTSDPIIDAVQGITNADMSLSDYANRRYIADPDKLTPEQIRITKLLLTEESSAAAPDPPTTAKIAEIAQTFSKKLEVQASRNFQLSFLKNNDNFIFLGSPRSNPWFSLFEDKLNFRFVFDHHLGSEFIRNLHSHPPEQETYVPSANGGGTGYSFAIIAFIQNPDQNGQILLLAGTNGEGTAAAGDFVTDLPQISRALQNCGIAPSGPARHFEMLLRTQTMAGVSRETNVAVCHNLP